MKGKNRFSLLVVLSISIRFCQADWFSENLANDQDFWVARATFCRLIEKDRKGELSREETLALEAASKSNHHQLSQLATLVLAKGYKRQEFPAEQWPLYIKKNLVKALRSDEIRNNVLGLPANATIAEDLLMNCQIGKDFTSLLTKEFLDGDIQSKRLSCRILVRHRNRIELPLCSINKHILAELVPSQYPERYLEPLSYLICLGSDNLLNILEDSANFSEFQSTLVQLACAANNVSWSPSQDIAEQWSAVCRKGDSRFLHIKCRQAALYLCPKTKDFIGEENIPERLKRLYRLEGKVKNGSPKEKYKWMQSWYPFLVTHCTSVAIRCPPL